NLEPIGWQPPEIQTTNATAATDPNVIVVNDNDLSDLGTTLVNTVPNVTSGNVLTVNSGLGLDSFGADGGPILSININGTLYPWNGTSSIAPGTPGNAADDIAGNNLSNINTGQGGKLSFNFATGAWSYTTPTNIPAAADDNFTYTLIDGDGDKSS